MSRYIVDTHIHTSDVSPCGHIPAADVARLYADAGYDAIAITDHYHSFFFKKCEGPWPRRLDQYLAGYRAAREAGEALGIAVILGIELKFIGTPNDYLVFGLDEEFLLEYPALNERSPAEVRRLVDSIGGLISVAHPFRPNMGPVDTGFVHAAEVMNGHPNHPSENPTALSYAREHDLLMTGGSDAHFPEGVATVHMAFPREVRDGLGLAAAVREGDCEIAGPDGFLLRIKAGEMVEASAPADGDSL